MRGKKAKAIRRAIYGEDVTSRRGRTYTKGPRGIVTADDKRRAYQCAKKQGLRETGAR